VLDETHKNVTQNPDFRIAFEGRSSSVLLLFGENPQETAATSMLSVCEAKLTNMVKDLEKRVQARPLSWEALKGAFSAKKTREEMENIHRHFQTLNSMAAVDAIALAAKTHCEIRRIREDQRQIRNTVADIRGHQLSQEEKVQKSRVLEWLTPIDYISQQRDAISRRQSGTGQWLLDSPDFLGWLQGDKAILFCSGIHGTGKTILTSIVIEHLLDQFRETQDIGIAYIYCNFRRKDEQKLDNMLASLLKQLSEVKHSLPEAILDLYDQHKTKPTRPSTDELSIALQSVSATYERVFIVVDALDECQTDGRCRDKFLREVFVLQDKCKANVFMTSRLIPDISRVFDGKPCVEIRATKEDMEKYLDGHMRDLSSFDDWGLELQNKIKEEILLAADGM
jgi:hypothetical protein